MTTRKRHTRTLNIFQMETIACFSTYTTLQRHSTSLIGQLSSQLTDQGMQFLRIARFFRETQSSRLDRQRRITERQREETQLVQHYAERLNFFVFSLNFWNNCMPNVSPLNTLTKFPSD